MNASSKALDLIKESESFAAEPYVCPAGKLTVGYGHVILNGEVHPYPLTEEYAVKLLVKDVAWAEAAINGFVKVALTQDQFDALVSFVFNVGKENFRTSTLLKKINAGDYAGAASEFDRWIYAAGKVLNGLKTRRNKERALWESTQ
jgi:lysozyme